MQQLPVLAKSTPCACNQLPGLATLIPIESERQTQDTKFRVTVLNWDRFTPKTDPETCPSNWFGPSCLRRNLASRPTPALASFRVRYRPTCREHQRRLDVKFGEEQGFMPFLC